MGFIIFLWNWFARLVWFLTFLTIEIGVFWIVYQSIHGAGMPILANILALVFAIWMVVEILMRIFVGGFKNLISYILKF